MPTTTISVGSVYQDMLTKNNYKVIGIIKQTVVFVPYPGISGTIVNMYTDENVFKIRMTIVPIKITVPTTSSSVTH